MTIYTKKEYDKMMKPMLDKIRASRPKGWTPVDLDIAAREFPVYDF